MKKIILIFLLVACGSSNSITSSIDDAINPTDLLSPSGGELCSRELNSDGQRPFFSPCYCQKEGPIYINIPFQEPLDEWQSAVDFWNNIAEKEIIFLSINDSSAEISPTNISIIYRENNSGWAGKCGAIYAQPVNQRSTTNRSVIAHEIGHAIGFQHSSDKNCIMFSNEGYMASNTCQLSLLKEYFK